MSATWSRILAATWVLVAVAHGFVSVASRRTGKPLWWIDDHGIFGSATPAVGAAAVYVVMLVGFILAVRRGADMIPLLPQHAPDHLPDRRIVIDQQDVFDRCFPRGLAEGCRGFHEANPFWRRAGRTEGRPSGIEDSSAGRCAG